LLYVFVVIGIITDFVGKVTVFYPNNNGLGEVKMNIQKMFVNGLTISEIRVLLSANLSKGGGENEV